MRLFLQAVGFTLGVCELVHPPKVCISFLIATYHTYAHLLLIPPATSALIGWSLGWPGLVLQTEDLIGCWQFGPWLCFVFTCLWAGLLVLGVARCVLLSYSPSRKLVGRGKKRPLWSEESLVFSGGIFDSLKLFHSLFGEAESTTQKRVLIVFSLMLSQSDVSGCSCE